MDWEDIRVAFTVSQTGTVSGAAEVLGVHHATVIRHVDRLEAKLGQKLFRRHSKGYEPTEAGQSLFNVAAVANEQFLQAEARIDGRDDEISGKIVITTLPQIAHMLMPAFDKFRALHPQVCVVIENSMRLYRLEYGEAHIALRAGKKPTDPDNVAVHLYDIEAGLYGSPAYTQKHGLFSETNRDGHVFISAASTDSRDPYSQWLKSHNLEDQIAVATDDVATQFVSIHEGLGLGFIEERAVAQRYPNLIEHLPPQPEWKAPVWQVTHRDMHRTPKVQAMSECLKEFAAELS